MTSPCRPSCRSWQAAYTGDAVEQAFFDATIGKLAEEAGLPFTLEEGREFAAVEQELDDAELDAVAGGTALCYVIGIADGIEARCIRQGRSLLRIRRPLGWLSGRLAWFHGIVRSDKARFRTLPLAAPVSCSSVIGALLKLRV